MIFFVRKIRNPVQVQDEEEDRDEGED